MKNFIYIIIGALVILSPLLAFAQVSISATIPGNNSNPGSTGTAGPGDYIANFYQFALLIGGVLALAIVVYGGILYMTSVGNPSGQSEAKEWLFSALWGVLLLAGAYLILKIINPQLVNLTLPTLQSTGPTANQVNVAGTGGGGSQTGNPGAINTPGQVMNTAQVTTALSAAGVSIKQGAQVNGMLQATVNDIQSLAEACQSNNGGSSCGVVVTEGTGAHEPGTAHTLGEKADIRSGGPLDNFITSLPIVGSRQEGTPPVTVNYYAYGPSTIADERNVPGVPAHWDLSAAKGVH